MSEGTPPTTTLSMAVSLCTTVTVAVSGSAEMFRTRKFPSFSSGSALYSVHPVMSARVPVISLSTFIEISVCKSLTSLPNTVLPPSSALTVRATENFR